MTLDQLFDKSQTKLITELTVMGFPSEKISDAIILLKDCIKRALTYGLKNNDIKGLVLLLNGVYHDTSRMQKIVDEYTKSLTIILSIEANMAMKSALRLIPLALRVTGDYMPTSYLNKSGFTSLINFRSIRKVDRIKLNKTLRFKKNMKRQFMKFVGPKKILRFNSLV